MNKPEFSTISLLVSSCLITLFIFIILLCTKACSERKETQQVKQESVNVYLVEKRDTINRFDIRYPEK